MCNAGRSGSKWCRPDAPVVTRHGDFANVHSPSAAFTGIDTLFLLFPLVENNEKSPLHSSGDVGEADTGVAWSWSGVARLYCVQSVTVTPDPFGHLPLRGRGGKKRALFR